MLSRSNNSVTAVELDILLPGCTFDIQPKGPKGRHKIGKLSATINAIEPSPDLNRPLYFDPIVSKITTSSALPTREKATENKPVSQSQVLQISSEDIGGLSSQVAIINKNLAFMTNPAFALLDQHLIGPTAFLIHGPEGTGKTLLLDRLAQCSWRETFRVDSTSSSKTPAKDMADAFEKAREAQPSLVLLDDLDKFLGKAETLVVRLRNELRKLEGTKVVVAAAARSIYDVDSSLRTTSAFKQELEIFPPNVRQRQDILRAIIGSDRSTAGIDFASLAERTHGFVGRDIHKLCGLARNHRVQDLLQSLSLDDERNASLDDILKGQDFLSQADFDASVDQVQPTVLKDSILEVPKVRWTDVAGLGHVQELLEAIMIRPFKVRFL